VKQTWADLKGDGVLQPPVPADRGRGKERKGGGGGRRKGTMEKEGREKKNIGRKKGGRIEEKSR
jgi:hypothetical protein